MTKRDVQYDPAMLLDLVERFVENPFDLAPGEVLGCMWSRQASEPGRLRAEPMPGLVLEVRRKEGAWVWDGWWEPPEGQGGLPRLQHRGGAARQVDAAFQAERWVLDEQERGRLPCRVEWRRAEGHADVYVAEPREGLRLRVRRRGRHGFWPERWEWLVAWWRPGWTMTLQVSPHRAFVGSDAERSLEEAQGAAEAFLREAEGRGLLHPSWRPAEAERPG